MVQQQQQHVVLFGRLAAVCSAPAGPARLDPEQMRPQRQFARKLKAARRRSRQRRRQRRLFDRNDLQHRPRRISRHDRLPRHPKPLREQRAQALVPPRKIAQRPRKRAAVERPTEPRRKRNHIVAARASSGGPLKPLQEPQPPLRIRQRDLGRPRLRQKRRPHHARLRRQPPRQSRYARRLEQAADRHLDGKHRPHPADQPCRQERVPAKLKEVVVDANPRQTQHLGIELTEDRLRGRPRRTQHPACTALRLRKRATVQLAVRRQRQSIQHHNRRRHHVVRQPRRNRRPQRRQVERYGRTDRHAFGTRAALSALAVLSVPGTLARHHVADQPPAPGAVVARHHNGLRYAGLLQQHSLDLAGLDPEPADLDLRIGAPQKLQHPIGTPPRQVPGPVHPAPGRTMQSPMRIGDKPLSRKPRTPQITPRQTQPRDVKLANNPNRNSLQPAVQHINPRVPDRTADRRACAVVTRSSRPSAIAADQIVVSVGPYRLTSRLRHVPASDPRSSPGNASPPVSMTRPCRAERSCAAVGQQRLP